MSKRNPTGIIAAAVIWLIIIGALAVSYKYLIQPSFQSKRDQETGSESRYKQDVTIALDSFSGYAILRSDAFRDRLKAQGTKVIFDDDGADYGRRIKALKRGTVDLAVFTIDSYIANGAELGDFPGSIVLVLDETQGADAMVAYKSGLNSLADLNHASASIVATPDSPSEFLARTAIAHFNLPELPGSWLDEGDGAAEVYKTFRHANAADKTAYVLWEPFVSRALEEDGAHVLIDSSSLKGYIVDVLVARRGLLQENEGLVRQVVEAYLRSAHTYREKEALAKLVYEDARKGGDTKFKKESARQLVEKIAWRNTLENYAHFGLLESGQAKGTPYLEDMIEQITDVLVKTGAIDQDPLAGRANTLFFKKLLADMKESNFHPGKEINLIQGAGGTVTDVETVRGAVELPELSDTQWEALVPVGEMRIEAIAFGRGSSRLNLSSQRVLTDLAKRLNSLPRYYLKVVGRARAEGDYEANKALAESRAQGAADKLIEDGVHPNRIKVVGAEPMSGGGEAQSVVFVVGQLAY